MPKPSRPAMTINWNDQELLYKFLKATYNARIHLADEGIPMKTKWEVVQEEISRIYPEHSFPKPSSLAKVYTNYTRSIAMQHSVTDAIPDKRLSKCEALACKLLVEHNTQHPASADSSRQSSDDDEERVQHRSSAQSTAEEPAAVDKQHKRRLLDWTKESVVHQFLQACEATRAHLTDPGVSQKSKWIAVQQQLLQLFPGCSVNAPDVLSAKFDRICKDVPADCDLSDGPPDDLSACDELACRLIIERNAQQHGEEQSQGEEEENENGRAVVSAFSEATGNTEDVGAGEVKRSKKRQAAIKPKKRVSLSWSNESFILQFLKLCQECKVHHRSEQTMMVSNKWQKVRNKLRQLFPGRNIPGSDKYLGEQFAKLRKNIAGRYDLSAGVPDGLSECDTLACKLALEKNVSNDEGQETDDDASVEDADDRGNARLNWNDDFTLLQFLQICESTRVHLVDTGMRRVLMKDKWEKVVQQMSELFPGCIVPSGDALGRRFSAICKIVIAQHDLSEGVPEGLEEWETLACKLALEDNAQRRLVRTEGDESDYASDEVENNDNSNVRVRLDWNDEAIVLQFLQICEAARVHLMDVGERIPMKDKWKMVAKQMSNSFPGYAASLDAMCRRFSAICKSATANHDLSEGVVPAGLEEWESLACKLALGDNLQRHAEDKTVIEDNHSDTDVSDDEDDDHDSGDARVRLNWNDEPVVLQFLQICEAARVHLADSGVGRVLMKDKWKNVAKQMSECFPGYSPGIQAMGKHFSSICMGAAANHDLSEGVVPAGLEEWESLACKLALENNTIQRRLLEIKPAEMMGAPASSVMPPQLSTQTLALPLGEPAPKTVEDEHDAQAKRAEISCSVHNERMECGEGHSVTDEESSFESPELLPLVENNGIGNGFQQLDQVHDQVQQLDAHLQPKNGKVHKRPRQLADEDDLEVFFAKKKLQLTGQVAILQLQLEVERAKHVSMRLEAENHKLEIDKKKLDLQLLEELKKLQRP